MKSVQERISCLAIIRELNLSGFSAKLKDVAVGPHFKSAEVVSLQAHWIGSPG